MLREVTEVVHRDNDEERLARLEALMEEYRINHGDLELHVQKLRVEAREQRQQLRDAIHEARERFRATNRTKTRSAARRRP